MVEPDRPQMAVWRMRIACWIPKAVNTHSEYVCNTNCFSTTTVVTRKPLKVTLYVYCLSCTEILPPNQKSVRVIKHLKGVASGMCGPFESKVVNATCGQRMTSVHDE
jgi:hypothetical protein